MSTAGGYDDLPDGLVVADEQRAVVVFNRAAATITRLDPAAALGKTLQDALPFQLVDGRAWWSCARPYDGLPTVTGHRERNLLLPGGTEVRVAF